MIMKNDNNNLSAVSKIPYSEIQIQSMNYKFIKQAQSNGNFCEINLKRLIKFKNCLPKFEHLEHCSGSRFMYVNSLSMKR